MPTKKSPSEVSQDDRDARRAREALKLLTADRSQVFGGEQLSSLGDGAQSSSGRRHPVGPGPEDERDAAQGPKGQGKERDGSPPSCAKSISTDGTVATADETADGSSRQGACVPGHVMLRRRSRPRHREFPSCSMSVPGIMRPCRYSGKSQGGPRRRASLPATVTGSSLSRSGSRSSFTSDASFTSGSSWVPLGVEFSPNMEVYVFRD